LARETGYISLILACEKHLFLARLRGAGVNAGRQGAKAGMQLLDRGADTNRRKLLDAGTQLFDPRGSTWPDASTAAPVHRKFGGVQLLERFGAWED
jgi:hypothetical protein